MEPNCFFCFFFYASQKSVFYSPRKDPSATSRRKEKNSEDKIDLPSFEWFCGIGPGTLNMSEAGTLPYTATHWLAHTSATWS